MASERGSTRLFFALWPDPAVREQLECICGSLPAHGGRPVIPENYHITLLFLGPVSTDRLPALLQESARIQAEAFTLTVGQTGWWRRSGTFWLAPTASPPALLQLVSRLRHIAAELGLPLDERDYQPHITVLRKVRRAAPSLPDFTPFPWSARKFCLVRSVTQADGPAYSVLGRWPLQHVPPPSC